MRWCQRECKDELLGDVNNGADVFCLPDDQILTMTASGVLEEMTNADAIASANLDGATAAASVDGKLFAYPITADNGYFLYYDKRYFQPQDVRTLNADLGNLRAEWEKICHGLVERMVSVCFFWKYRDDAWFK